MQGPDFGNTINTFLPKHPPKHFLELCKLVSKMFTKLVEDAFSKWDLGYKQLTGNFEGIILWLVE